MPDADRSTEILKPPPNPCHVEAVKRFVFNETGNIMISTTATESEEISDSVKDVFAEVAVFFAAMTKAVINTVNPHAEKKKDGSPVYYSMYNLDALQAAIDGSGCFIQVAEEDVTHKATKWGADFSKDLVQAVLGLATGTSEIAFATAVVASVGQEGVNISGQKTSDYSKVANIIFVCEYLLGMPMVSAMVVSADAKETAQQFKAGPCFKEQSKSIKLSLHKDTYMFVAPKFIKKYAGDLNAGMNDPAFLALVANLQRQISHAPNARGVYDISNPAEPVLVSDKLVAGTNYVIYGEFFGDQIGKLELLDAAGKPAAAGTTVTVTANGWSGNSIGLTVAHTGEDSASLIIKGTIPQGSPHAGESFTVGPFVFAATK